jgi:GT2 family glycosyltransferase
MAHVNRPSTPEDVVYAYQAFLGREPESQAVVSEKLRLSLAELVTTTLSSDEFRRYVLKPLLAGGGIDRRFDGAPPTGVRAWAAGVFGLDLAELHRASNWGLFVLEALSAAQAAPDLAAFSLLDEDRPAVSRALNLRRQAAEHAALTGAIEILDDEVIEGWALDADEPDRPLVIHLLMDGVVVAAATPDRFRRDLQDLHGGAGLFGFRVDLPLVPEPLAAGSVRVDLVEQASQRRLASRILARDPQPRLDALSHVTALLQEVKERLQAVETQMPQARAAASFSVRSYDAYRQAYGAPFPTELKRQREQASSWAFQPRFLIYTEAADESGRLTQISLEQQSYANWCWRRDAGPLQEGDWFVFLTWGDELEPDALFRLAAAVREGDRPLVLTVDDDELQDDGLGRRTFSAPRLRGVYDPWLALQKAEAGAFVAAEALFAARAGVEAKAFDAVISFRLAAAAGPSRVRHLPRVLHHRRPLVTPPLQPPEGMVQAVRREILRTGVRATVARHEDVLGAVVPDALQIRPNGPQARLASVIIPTRDRLDLIRPCIEGLLATRSANATPFELLVVDNGGEDEDTTRYITELAQRGDVRRIVDASSFNWSRLNNRAAAQATGDVVVFLNDDTTPVAGAWCDELCLWATWPAVGIVGARLIYGDGTIQHAGVVTGVFGEAAHEGVGDPGQDPGYLGRHALVRSVNAVTGACMAVRRECFDALGGFDEGFAVAYNDIDFCLRAQSRGWAVLYAPQAAFHHFESKTRRFEAQQKETARIERQRAAARLHNLWGARLTQDPFYNPHFERWAPPFSRLAAPPA